MIKNKEQFGYRGIKIRGICIHNTGNALSAAENYALMETSTGNEGCHFFIDEKEVIQAMPLNYCVYHTGMGRDWACKHALAIEICRSQSSAELYAAAEAKAVEFVKSLMERYSLTTEDLYFHIDFNPRTYCPHRILANETKKEWIGRNF